MAKPVARKFDIIWTAQLKKVTENLRPVKCMVLHFPAVVFFVIRHFQVL